MTETSKLYQDLMRQAMNERNNITTKSLKELSRAYKKAAQDITKRLDKEKGGFTQAWLKDYQKYLNMRYEQLNKQIEGIVTGAIQNSSKVAASVEGDFLTYVAGKYNLDVDTDIISKFYSTPDSIINSIINGGFYKDNKSLSERVWDYSNKNVSDIQKIISEGIVGQRRYEDIIKDLSSYVDPSKRKPWDWNKVYPGVGKKVDYNAQRLLRTSITQTFQAVSVNKMQQNKYVEGVKWNLSSEHFSRQVSRFGEDICDEYVRNTHGFNEPGVFKKNEVPMQHPQCLCYMSAYIPYSFDELANKIAKDYEVGKYADSTDASTSNKTYSKNDINGTLKQINKKYHDGIISQVNKGRNLESETFANVSDKLKFMVDEYQFNRYDVGTKEIIINLADDSKQGLTSFFHESGHSIDNIVDNYFYSTDTKYGYKKAIKQDIKDYTKKIKSEFKKEFGHVPDENEIWDYVNMERDIFGGDKLRNISDMVSGASDGLFEGDYGHDTSYWKRKGVLEQECFANMYSTYITGDSEVKNLLEEVFPGATKVYEEMIKDILSGVK